MNGVWLGRGGSELEIRPDISGGGQFLKCYCIFGFNVPATYINPSSPVGSFINLFPLIFIAMAVLMVIWMGIKNEWGMVGTIIVMAIVIYIAIALLTGMHAMNVNILGV